MGGRTNGGMVPKTPKGKLTHFFSTRKKKNKTNAFILIGQRKTKFLKRII